MYEGAKLWNSISNGIKTTENISEFIAILKQDAREAMRVVFFCTYKTYLYA